MESSFANSIAPIIRKALEFIHEISTQPTDWDVPKIRDFQSKIRTSLRKAESQLKPRGAASWERIQYALVAWIDEQCILIRWQGSEWWKNNSLEMYFFESRVSHNDFYTKAEAAIADNDRNAIEMYFLCVILGFRGVYIDLRSKNPAYVELAQEFIEKNHLQPDLRDWLRRISGYIPIGESTSQLKVKKTEGYGATPLNSKIDFLTAALFGVLGVAALVSYVLIYFGDWLQS